VVSALRALMLLHRSECPMDGPAPTMLRMELGRIAVYLPKCSNIATRRPGRVAEDCAIRLLI
jgi:hypothetical protein